MKVVVDTNVLVSSFINAGGKPAMIIDYILNNKATPVVNEEILQEYETVLSRKKFCIKKEDMRVLTDYFRFYSVAAESAPALPVGTKVHKEDEKFLQAAYAAEADYLITGNRKHYPGTFKGKLRIVTPAEFLTAVGIR